MCVSLELAASGRLWLNSLMMCEGSWARVWDTDCTEKLSALTCQTDRVFFVFDEGLSLYF